VITTFDTAPALDLAEDERFFYDSVYQFADREVRPLVRGMDERAKIPPDLIEKLFALGVMGIEIPEIYDGAGASFFHAVLAVEALSRVDPAIGVMVDVQNTLCINALQVGDEFVLNGRKLWITNAAEADLFVVFANADPAAGYRGITAFLVERSFAGFSVGKKEDKLGIRASSTCELLFEDCHVPRANVLGEIGKGYKIAMETLNEGRIGIGAQMVGVATGALDHTIAYVRERKQFGRAISEFQAVQHQIARAAMEVAAARLMVYQAARLKDAGRPFLTEAAMCKLFSSEVAERVTSLAINLFGGNGFVKEYPVEKLWRDAKIGQIYEGTSNLQLQTIAKQLLG
jgi:alkylation response protein AidB-like acyl-CoA dehydrogenase